MFFSLEKNLLWRRIYGDYVENFFLALSNFYPSYRHWMYTIELLKKTINHNTLCEVSVRSFRTQTIFAASDNHGRWIYYEHRDLKTMHSLY